MPSMRAALGSSALALAGLALTALGAPAGAKPGHPGAADDRGRQQAEAALETVRGLVDGTRAATRGKVEVTTALTELFTKRHLLDDRERAEADRLLARPDGDGPALVDWDSQWQPINEAPALCSAVVCVHYVTTGENAATPEHAQATLDTVTYAWNRIIGEMGYRTPRPDGTRGERPGQPATQGKIDVYLAELSTMGAFGYAAPETDVPSDGQSHTNTGYLVLDNDYREFGGCPTQTACLRVTAAHELFHLVQYAYDSGENTFWMESTATWMEERVHDAIDDNRRYLSTSQLMRPDITLTSTNPHGFPYGNWVFTEFYTHRLGDWVARRAWEYAAGPSRTWYAAVSLALRDAGSSFSVNFAQFSATSPHPAFYYPEGAAYPVRVPVEGRENGSAAYLVDSLASQVITFRPGDAPAGHTRINLSTFGPVGWPFHGYAIVSVLDGRKWAYYIAMTDGSGSISLPFSRNLISSVTLSLSNTWAANDQRMGYRATTS